MEGGSSGRGGVSSTEVGIPEAWLDTEAAKIAEKNHALLRQVSTRISHLSQNEHAMSDTVGPAAVEVDGEDVGKSQEIGFDPFFTVLEGVTGDGVFAAEPGAANASGHTVVEATIFSIDEMSTGIGHG